MAQYPKYGKPGKFQWRCREKDREASRQYRRSNPEETRRKSRIDNWRTKGINITYPEFLQRLQNQGGVCAICGEEDTTQHPWHVDHCHQSGKIRGVLCSNCNKGIGMLDDSSALLRRGADYLEGKR
jgi:hypothetical protein